MTILLRFTAADGFAVLPIERDWCEREPNPYIDVLSYEAPMGGGHAWGLGAPTKPEDYAVTLQGGRLPREGASSATECRDSWLCVFKIAPVSKRMLADIAPLLAGSLQGTDTRTGATLAVFRAGDMVSDPRELEFAGRATHVEATGTATYLPRAPWLYWRGDRSPAVVPRGELAAILDSEHARDLVRAINDVLSARAA